MNTKEKTPIIVMEKVEETEYDESIIRIIGAVKTEAEAQEVCDKLGPMFFFKSIPFYPAGKLVKKTRTRTFTCDNCNEKKQGEPNLDYEYDQNHPPKLCDECWE